MTGISAGSAIATTIINITWTIDGVPINELTNINVPPFMLNVRTIDLVIRNVSADLNGHLISCTATISDGSMATCSPLPIQVQG